MESSAEQLLQSYCIKDLREMVDDLNAKAESKKEELQLMVGSKYHDFIQSADAIAVMKDHADGVGGKLEKFSDMNATLVMTTKSLLEGAGATSGKDIKETTPASRTAEEDLMGKDSSYVWACLDECDVYAAAKVVMLADVLRSSCLAKSSPLAEYMITGSSSSGSDGFQSLLAKKRDDFVITSNLLATVSEDCYLLLLVPESTHSSRIRALCSLGLLTRKSIQELLEIFLQSADIMLEDILSESSAERNHSTKLHEFVKCLQQTFFDVYFSFGGDGDVCAITSLQAAFLRELNHSLGSELFDEKKILRGKLDWLALRGIFDPWLDKAMKKASLLTDKALGHMESAVEVSRLQYEVWKTSTFREGEGEETRRYSLAEWKRASSALLSKQSTGKSSFWGGGRGASSSSVGGNESESLLWSSLRAPFVTHAERLLRSSCLGVLTKTKSRLLGIFEAEGMHVDPHTLELDLNVTSSYQECEADGNGDDNDTESDKNNNTANDYGSYLRPTVPARLPFSPFIFKQAETVKGLFEQEIVAMVKNMQISPEISSPASKVSDPQATAALTKAIFVQTSQLVAHFLTMLRCLQSSFGKAVKERHQELQQQSPREQGSRLMSASGRSNEDAYQDARMSTLLSGVLVLGRISWSLKTRGNFFKSIFTNIMDAYHNSITSSARRFDLSTDDQLRSAFEIADANGDGLLTVDEAVEALQAINVSNTDEHSVEYYEFLTAELTPSLSLPELALMCGDLLVPEKCMPLEHCMTCLDAMVNQTHACWCDILVKDLGASLGKNLLGEFGRVGLSRDFKALWEQSTVNLDGGVGGAGAENVLLPIMVSSSLTTFLSMLNFRVTRGILSVDTVQDPIDEDIGMGIGGGLQAGCLAAHIQERLCESSVHVVLSAYNELFQEVYSAEIRTGSRRKGDAEWKEECALQAIFDLLSLRRLIQGGDVRPSTDNALQKTLRTWETLIDPVNFEFSAPCVERNVDKHLLISSLVLAGFNGIPSVKSVARRRVDGGDSQQQQQQQHNLFAQTQAGASIPKFALLPLAITMAASRTAANSKTNGRHLIRQAEKDNKETDDAAEQLNLGKYLSFFN